MTTFNFQQFSVRQKQSAMKVCTDSILFGAMAPVDGGDRVLDVGAGTGVLSLMAAQLGAARVTAVELTDEAYQECRINFGASPWADRLTSVHQDIQSFALKAAGQSYDLIISNPPFFDNHFKSGDPLRHIARHTDRLSYADLIGIADRLMAPEGLLYLLMPVHAVAKFAAAAAASGFYLVRQTDYRAYTHSEAKVAALTFSRTAAVLVKDNLIVYESAGVYTQVSEQYLSAFLLRFLRTGK
jgi:tRNA1Val (adenine37-N6)-methyltransferase